MGQEDPDFIYEQESLDLPVDQEEFDHEVAKKISEIHVVNNSLVPAGAILNRIPYRVGDIFDPLYSSTLIRNVYDLGYFKTVDLQIEDAPDGTIILYIVVQEDPPINQISYKGNKHFKASEIEKKLKLSELPTADVKKLAKAARRIKQLYAEKDFHHAVVEPTVEITPEGRANVIFNITENKRSLVKRVSFKGNFSIPSRKLRTLIFTREDWPLSFMDKSGSFQQEELEKDRHRIENFYQSNGFLTARVTDVQVNELPESGNYEITFVIDEGERYKVSSISIPGKDLLPEAELIRRVGIYPGYLYSKERIHNAIEKLKLIWGEFGYINADIIPIIEPDMQNKTVNITLDTELGTKAILNRIIIKGHKKTREEVIRRQLTVIEGEPLTTQNIERSKTRVSSLGYFEPREGVTTRLIRTSPELVDLELEVKEIKTGKLWTTLGFNGSFQDITSPSKAVRFGLNIADTNILGRGISGYASTSLATDEQTFNFNLTNPWLFGRPLTGAVDFYYRQLVYEEVKNAENNPEERVIGGGFTLGYISQYLTDIRVLFQAGTDHISYKRELKVLLTEETRPFKQELELILRRRFEPGQLTWLSNTFGQDLRNNPNHPTRGYQWSVISKLGLPIIDDKFGFFKLETDATWYTPLIGEFDLIFMIHGHFGWIHPFRGHNIPYRELFHIGGPASVRGFIFGQIGPQLFGDSLGATKAFFVNSELIFPITKDFSMKAAIFYDGGAGWDTPDAERITRGLLKNNRFHYRHAIGLSLRLLKPTPVRIDFGFKLDRRRNEKPFEVSFTGVREF